MKVTKKTQEQIDSYENTDTHKMRKVSETGYYAFVCMNEMCREAFTGDDLIVEHHNVYECPICGEEIVGLDESEFNRMYTIDL